MGKSLVGCRGNQTRIGRIVIELNIDWQGLYAAFQTNTAEYKCFLDLESGKVIKLGPGDPEHEKVKSKPGAYRTVEVVPSRIQYQWVSEFVKSIEHESIKSRMEAAINGKGAFRRFKDILLTLPDERRRWFEFRDRRMRVRVAEWIKENGIHPTNEPTWDDDIDSAEFEAETVAATAAVANVLKAACATADLTLEAETVDKVAVALLESFQMIPR